MIAFIIQSSISALVKYTMEHQRVVRGSRFSQSGHIHSIFLCTAHFFNKCLYCILRKAHHYKGSRHAG
uniref:Uncharacterized protein n=1 Tax=Arundo donax TaxID=35708 RepID=A0A0A8Y4N9_ARUDO